VRPYISQPGKPAALVAPTAPVAAELTGRIRTAVLAQLGGQVDQTLLDVIIQRVLQSTGVK
jgi:hypothetical protein